MSYKIIILMFRLSQLWPAGIFEASLSVLLSELAYFLAQIFFGSIFTLFIVLVLYLFLFVFYHAGSWTRGFMHAWQALYHWIIPLALALLFFILKQGLLLQTWKPLNLQSSCLSPLVSRRSYFSQLYSQSVSQSSSLRDLDPFNDSV